VYQQLDLRTGEPGRCRGNYVLMNRTKMSKAAAAASGGSVPAGTLLR
jgi:hypothetical protein